jgi:uncharacterized membrane protein YkvA (DUF1232 family)
VTEQARDPEFQLDTPTYEAFHATVRRLAARVAANAGLGKQGDRFAAYALAAPDLIVLAGRALTDDRVPRAQKGEILASVLYLASPIDIFPEALFGPFGLVDDVVVATRLFDLLLNKLEPEILRAHWPGDRAVLETLQGIATEARKIFGAGLKNGVRVLVKRGAREIGKRLRDAGFDPARLLGGGAEAPSA